MLEVIKTLNKPEENTIGCLKTLLEDAESGEIIGIVYACIHGDGKCSYSKVGMLDLQPNRLAGAISNGLLHYQLGHVLEYIPYGE